jgi:putative acyl-CoA dehydrogenase
MPGGNPCPSAWKATRSFNQSPPYEDVDLFTSDRPLRDAVAANGGATDAKALAAFGQGSAPVSAIWEGSGNIMALDVLRVFTRDREAARTVVAALVAGAGDLPACREAARDIEADLSPAGPEGKPALWSSRWHSWPERRLCANARRQKLATFSRARVSRIAMAVYSEQAPSRAATWILSCDARCRCN